MEYQPLKMQKIIEVESLVTLHHFEYTPSLNYAGEAHDFWEFVYVDSGQVEAGADRQVRHLTTGNIIFHKPMEFHTLRAVGGSAPSLLIVSFVSHSAAMKHFEHLVEAVAEEDKSLLATLLKTGREAFDTPLHVPGQSVLRRAPSALPGTEQMLGNTLEMLLLKMLQKNVAVAKPAAHTLLPKTTTGDGNDRLDAILAYLREHIGENMSIGHIAKNNYISRSQLQWLFHKAFQRGVADTFHAIKADKAKELLRSGAYSCTEIAQALGYNTSVSFNKQFKKQTGYSPRVYRNTVKGLSEKVSGKS